MIPDTQSDRTFSHVDPIFDVSYIAYSILSGYTITLKTIQSTDSAPQILHHTTTKQPENEHIQATKTIEITERSSSKLLRNNRPLSFLQRHYFSSNPGVVS